MSIVKWSRCTPFISVQTDISICTDVRTSQQCANNSCCFWFHHRMISHPLFIPSLYRNVWWWWWLKTVIYRCLSWHMIKAEYAIKPQRKWNEQTWTDVSSTSHLTCRRVRMDAEEVSVWYGGVRLRLALIYSVTGRPSAVKVQVGSLRIVFWDQTVVSCTRRPWTNMAAVKDVGGWRQVQMEVGSPGYAAKAGCEGLCCWGWRPDRFRVAETTPERWNRLGPTDRCDFFTQLRKRWSSTVSWSTQMALMWFSSSNLTDKEAKPAVISIYLYAFLNSFYHFHFL